LIRIASRVGSQGTLGDLRSAIEKSLLTAFMPALARNAVLRLLDEAGIRATEAAKHKDVRVFFCLFKCTEQKVKYLFIF
jgi:hypothetical protein